MSRQPKGRSHEGNDNLHGNAPDQSRVVLLLVDVINDLNFPGNTGFGAPVRSAGEINRQTEKAMQEVRYSGYLRQRQPGPMAF